MAPTTTLPQVTLRFPTAKAQDPRIAVTLDEPATPWPITVYFLNLANEEGSGAAFVNVGLELGHRFDRRPDEQLVFEHLPRPLDRRAVQRVTEQFREYVEYARAALEHGVARRTPGANAPASRRREMTDEFLSMIAEQYREWSAGGGRAVTEIANAHGVNRSTASRWVDAARNRGILESRGRTVASSWIIARGERPSRRFRVLYRLGGRESRQHYGGSFRTKAEALKRRRWIDGGLAGLRVPDLSVLNVEPIKAPTVADAAERWQASRVDLAENTKTRHGLELNRIRPLLGSVGVDALIPSDVAEFVATLAGDGYARGTIRKTLQTLAMVVDDAGVTPNPCRDKHVRLPREEPEEINPPTAAQVKSVYRLLPSKHRLALLWLDWSGARVSSVDLTLVGDSTSRAAACGCVRPRRRPARRSGSTCTRSLPTRLSSNSARVRIATRTRACSRVPAPTRCGRRSRRRARRLASRCGRRTICGIGESRSCICAVCRGARIGEFVGQRDISVTADVYSHVLADETELGYADVLSLS